MQWHVTKVLARRVSSHPMDTHFGRNTRKIPLISCNFKGKRAFWMASFLCLAKSLHVTCSQPIKRSLNVQEV